MRTRFDRWIFEGYPISLDGLALYRILFAAFFLIFGVPKFGWVSQLPDFFYYPVAISIAPFFQGFPPAWFTQGSSLLLSLGFVLLLFGWRTRWVSLSIFVLVIVNRTFGFSLGKIDHDIMLWLTLLCMAFSHWEGRYSLDALDGRERPPQTWTVSLVALLLGFAMFSAGLPKLMGGWLDPGTQATRGYLFQMFHGGGRQALLAPWLIQIESAWFWEPLDWFAVWFELLFLPAVFFPRWFRFMVGVAVVFHVGNYVMLNIGFSTNLIAYLLFVRWDWLLGWLRKRSWLARLNRFIHLRTLLITAAAYLMYHALLVWVVPAWLGQRLVVAIDEALPFSYGLFLTGAMLAAGVVVILLHLRTLWRMRKLRLAAPHSPEGSPLSES